jgi:hypothetical protein
MSVRLANGSKTWRVIQDNQMNYQKARLLKFNENMVVGDNNWLLPVPLELS